MSSLFKLPRASRLFTHFVRSLPQRSVGSPGLHISSVRRAISTGASIAEGRHRINSVSSLVGIPILLAGVSACITTQYCADELPEPDQVEVVNWSGTHSVTTQRYYTPETLDQLKAIVNLCHEQELPLRPVGSALSPNGIGLSPDGMVNLALMDKVLSVDKERGLVRVQAGIRVEALVEALRPYGLTLANYASIVEQQIGGFVQIGAHGTGAEIPTVDEQVVALKIITPAAGELDLAKSETDEDDDMLFRLARTSLGMLGVVAEVTLQCVPAHRLIERTKVVKREDVVANHERWLKEHKHLRYMWIPYTDAVVVITCDLFEGNDVETGVESNKSADPSQTARELLLLNKKCKLSEKTIRGLSFTELRSELLRMDPLNHAWVARVNGAEADFWKNSEGTRIDWSDKILQFDCGGQQWVSEVVFPVHSPNSDIDYVGNILREIELCKIAAPAPIEQRWSAASSSPLSGASEKRTRELAPIYSWVGIIMYLPDATDSEAVRARADTTEAFHNYKRMCGKFWSGIGAVEHWAKIELPKDAKERVELQLRMANKYPLDVLNAVRALFDPKGILKNELTSLLLDGSTMISGNLLNSASSSRVGA